MRRLLATASLAAVLPLPALAQGAPSWLELFSPDRILQSVLQSGVVALRSQVDLKYGGMSVDLRGGRITLTDLRFWPMPPWEGGGDCEVRIDRMTIRTAALDEPERLRLKIQASGTEADALCLPEEPRGALGMAGLEALDIPRLTLDVDYDVPSAAAEVALHVMVSDVASADLTAAFSYVALDGREDMDNPVPVMFLEHAALSVENAGIWEVVAPMIPPEFTQPNAGMMVEGMIGQMLAEANRDTEEFAGGGDPSRLTDPQSVFISSLAEAWPAFLENPERIVAETDIDGDVFLDFDRIEDDPREIFAAVNPRVALVPAAADEILPAALVQSALDGDDLTEDEQRAVGLALVTGAGAPRSLSAGLDLLAGLAEAGDGPAAMALSDALEARDLGAAYRWALAAGAAGETGAAARLDRLEARLGMAEVLEIQEEVSGEDEHDMASLGSVAAIRAEAAMRLTGRGMARAYGIAAMWAMIGAAAGDPEATDILDEIDDRMRMADDAGRERWAASEDAASELAMEAWLGQDLPAQFSR